MQQRVIQDAIDTYRQAEICFDELCNRMATFADREYEIPADLSLEFDLADQKVLAAYQRLDALLTAQKAGEVLRVLEQVRAVH